MTEIPEHLLKRAAGAATRPRPAPARRRRPAAATPARLAAADDPARPNPGPPARAQPRRHGGRGRGRRPTAARRRRWRLPHRRSPGRPGRADRRQGQVGAGPGATPSGCSPWSSAGRSRRSSHRRSTRCTSGRTCSPPSSSPCWSSPAFTLASRSSSTRRCSSWPTPPDAEPVQGAVVLPRPAGAADDVPPDDRGRDDPWRRPVRVDLRPYIDKEPLEPARGPQVGQLLMTIHLMFWAVLMIIGSFFRGQGFNFTCRGKRPVLPPLTEGGTPDVCRSHHRHRHPGPRRAGRGRFVDPRPPSDVSGPGPLSGETKSTDDRSGARAQPETVVDGAYRPQLEAEAAVAPQAAALVPAREAPVPVVAADPDALGVTRRQFLNRSTVTLTTAGVAGLLHDRLRRLPVPTPTGGFGHQVTVGSSPTSSRRPGRATGSSPPRGADWITPYPADALRGAQTVYSARDLRRDGGRNGGALPEVPPSRLQGAACADARSGSSARATVRNTTASARSGPALRPRGLDRFPIDRRRQRQRAHRHRQRLARPPIGTDTTGQGAEGRRACPAGASIDDCFLFRDRPPGPLNVDRRWLSHGGIVVGWLVYALLNIRGAARQEVAPRSSWPRTGRPTPGDEVLEGRRLEHVQLSGVLLLLVIVIGLPVYWILEPGRQTGAKRGDRRTSFIELGRPRSSPRPATTPRRSTAPAATVA